MTNVKQKIKEITVNGEVKNRFGYDDSPDGAAAAEAWYLEQLAKADGNYLPAHTVADVDNPEVTKRSDLKNKLNSVTDPAAKDILQMLLKEMID